MGKRRVRRHFSESFKTQLVTETYAPGTSVSVVARRHDINANLLFRWRDDPRFANEAGHFLPIEIKAAENDAVGHAVPGHSAPELAIWIGSDVRLAIKGDYDPSVLGALICNLRARA
mgnify:CR=1 FL=1|jgi:transposase